MKVTYCVYNCCQVVPFFLEFDLKAPITWHPWLLSWVVQFLLPVLGSQYVAMCSSNRVVLTHVLISKVREDWANVLFIFKILRNEHRAYR